MNSLTKRSSSLSVISGVSGKLISLNKSSFFKFENSEDIWADFVNHEVNFTGESHIITVFNTNESLELNQKVDPEYLEQVSKIIFIKSNFSNPLAVDLSNSFHCSKLGLIDNQDVATYFLIHPQLFGDDSACIYSRDLKLQKLDIKREQGLNLNYERKSQAEWVCVGPLNHERGLHLNLNWTALDGSSRTGKLRLYLNPKVSVTYRLMMVLQNVQSLGALIQFVQVELNNPSARLIQFNEVPISSSPRFTENIQTVLLDFESDLPFSNKTLQLIASSCDPNYRKEDLFMVAPRKVANAVVPASEDYSFWNRSACAVQTKMISKIEHPQTNVELVLSKDEEQNVLNGLKSNIFVAPTVHNTPASGLNKLLGIVSNFPWSNLPALINPD